MIMLSDKQQSFINTALPRMTIVEGCISSGKTFICNHKAVKHIIYNYKGRGLIFFIGKTLNTLKKNILEPLEKEYDGYFEYSLGRKEALLCGIKIHLEGCNDIRAENKIRGSTAEFIYGDELTLWNREFLTRCLGSLRTPNAVFLGSTNPDRPDNFVKEEYIDRSEELGLRNIKFKFEDNPSLTEEYIKQVNLEYTGVLHDRFIKGLWVTADGLIYEWFVRDSERYVIDTGQYLKDNNKTIKAVFVGVDWGNCGIGNAAVAIGITQNYSDIIVLDEYYIDDKTIDPQTLEEKLCVFISRIVSDYGSCRVFCDNAIGTFTNGLHNACKRQGIQAVVKNCVKHNIIDRITLENKLFAQDRIKINHKCHNMIKALKNAVWTDENAKDERMKDEKNNSHIIDAFEYAICTETANIEKAGHIDRR